MAKQCRSNPNAKAAGSPAYQKFKQKSLSLHCIKLYHGSLKTAWQAGAQIFHTLRGNKYVVLNPHPDAFFGDVNAQLGDANDARLYGMVVVTGIMGIKT